MIHINDITLHWEKNVQIVEHQDMTIKVCCSWYLFVPMYQISYAHFQNPAKIFGRSNPQSRLQSLLSH